MTQRSHPVHHLDQTFDHALARLRTGDGGGVLLLHGALGVGISHRLEQFAAHSESEFLVLRATGEALNCEPYRVWRELLAAAHLHPRRASGMLAGGDPDQPRSARAVLRNLANALQRIGTATVIIIDHWENVDPGSRRVLGLIETEITLGNVLVVIAGDQSIASLPRTDFRSPSSQIEARFHTQLVSGPEPEEIATLISRRYPGVSAALVAAATAQLIAHCGHNYASIMIALRSLEAEQAPDQVLHTLVSGSLGGPPARSRESPTLSQEQTPVVVGRPREMIASLVGSLTESDREALGIWLLGSQFSRAEICAIADLKEEDLETAIRAAHRRGLIPSVWVRASEVHQLVTEALLAGLSVGAFRRTHHRLGEQARSRNQIFSAVHHFLEAGPEVAGSELLKVLREAWRSAHSWRAHDAMTRYRAVISELDTDPTGSDPELLANDQKLISEMESAVHHLVTALRDVDPIAVTRHFETVRDITDQVDTDPVVAWFWCLQAVRALMEADLVRVTHCRQMVERYGPEMTRWPQIALAQLSGDWSQVSVGSDESELAAFIGVQKGEVVRSDLSLAARTDLFHTMLTAQVAIGNRDPEAAKEILEYLEPCVDLIAVHPDGLMVLGPVASTVADLLRVLSSPSSPSSDSEDVLPATSLRSESLRATAGRIAQEMNSPWMMSSVTEATKRSLLTGIGLSERELEVAGLLARGLTTAVIAERLNFSSSTIRRDIATLGSAVGASQRQDLIKRLRALGFVDKGL